MNLPGNHYTSALTQKGATAPGMGDKFSQGSHIISQNIVPYLVNILALS